MRFVSGGRVGQNARPDAGFGTRDRYGVLGPSIVPARQTNEGVGFEVSKNRETAEHFFDACETGKGWEVCQQYCHPDASFSAQAPALADIDTLEGYTAWTKGLLTPIPDGHYELRGLAEDADRNVVLAYSVFHGSQTGPGGPVAPTGNTVAAEYVYAMHFDGDRIKHMTKVWNDGVSLQQLGWA